jgi:hypothetical protein
MAPPVAANHACAWPNQWHTALLPTSDIHVQVDNIIAAKPSDTFNANRQQQILHCALPACLLTVCMRQGSATQPLCNAQRSSSAQQWHSAP